MSGSSQRLRAINAAAYLGVSRSTLAKWRMRGEGPAWHRCGPRIVYYLPEELDQWLGHCDSTRIASRRAVR
jgi:predicted DNA-binding transcriptional regulator AlpA